MEIEVIDSGFSKTLYGLAGTVEDQKYGEKGMELMDALWAEVRSKDLKHKGINHWVYYPEYELFCAVELEDAPEADSVLEKRNLEFPRYVRYLHVGPYSQLTEVWENVKKEIGERGLTAGLPALEIYGDWNEDPSKLQTEILIPLRFV